MSEVLRIEASDGVEPVIATLESDGVCVVAGALTPLQLSGLNADLDAVVVSSSPSSLVLCGTPPIWLKINPTHLTEAPTTATYCKAGLATTTTPTPIHSPRQVSSSKNISARSRTR